MAATLDTYAAPVLRDKLVPEITTSDVMQVLTSIWLRKPETARWNRSVEPLGRSVNGSAW